jgi:hypothetical protein
MTSSLFSSFQENTKCESRFFADTCTRRVPIFYLVYACQNHKMSTLEDFESTLLQVLTTPEILRLVLWWLPTVSNIYQCFKLKAIYTPLSPLI